MPKKKTKKSKRRAKRSPLSASQVQDFVSSIVDEDLHAMRVLSLGNAVVGVLRAAALGVHAIGHGLASALGLQDKHAIKQVDRLLSNAGLDVWAIFALWVPFVVGPRKEIFVNLDWTEFDKSDQSSLVVGTQTSHGRSTPLVWQTVVKSELKGKRNAHEYRLLARLREVVPPETKVTVVADRGFSDHKLYRFLTQHGFEFIIRFRSSVNVTDAKGETRKAKAWTTKDGRMRVLRNAKVTAKRYPVAKVVAVHNPKMKDAWFLAASDSSLSGSEVRKRYGKRFTCEETFRDLKDLRYGMGLSWRRVSTTERRDRMFLFAALAHALLTLLGYAGERAGLDRMLKANTVARRTLSLFKQGCRWYDLIPNMPEERLALLMKHFDEAVREHALFLAVFGVL